MPSSPPLSWADLAGRSVGIWGWRLEGHLALERLGRSVSEVVVVDDQAHHLPPGDQPPGYMDVLTPSEGGLDALARCQVVIKSPGVSRYRPEIIELERRGVAVVGGLGLWLEEVDRSRVVCITGTKGKSTTASVMAHLLERLGQRSFLGGNIGRPPWALDAPTDVDWWVIETSSYQTTDCWSAPPVVAVTSLGADHLDWHTSVERYQVDKLSLCRLPGAHLTVANGRDVELRRRRSLLGPRVEWVGDPDTAITPSPSWVTPLNLVGHHNVMNALLAQACLSAMGVQGANDDQALAAAAEGFVGLPSRLQSIGIVAGVEFVDDSLSTNVLATCAALDAFAQRPVALIVGGFDRGIDYDPLGLHLTQRRTPTLVLAVPDAGARIANALLACQLPSHVSVAEISDETDAVRAAFSWARSCEGVVLLSPAVPSFGRFGDYRERAQSFANVMKDLARQG